MTPDEFRRYGREVIDWIADYYERVESLPVGAQVKPGEVRSKLPAAPPEHGERFEAVLRDMDEIVLPAMTHWQHPSFFGFFPANASGPAILGDLLASGLGVQAMMWSTSPAATELETHVLDWFASLLGLPDQFRSSEGPPADEGVAGGGGPGGGVIQQSASDATLVALLAALHRASGGATAHTGVGGTRYADYTSAESHSSVEKACRIAGLGADALRKLDVDPATQAARADQLRELIGRDVADGIRPALVVATIGTTGAGGVDPVREMATMAHEHGAWLHVDGAWAG
ncbi:MAG: pyridoxal phosphate-dependent decarboxylase family protein, partial [Trebonia sp.]